jgi:hypothetical protein
MNEAGHTSSMTEKIYCCEDPSESGDGQSRLEIVLPLVVYLAATVILFPWYQYVINNDGVSYLSIARKYATADWEHAVNGYWGPLLSWLVAPFIRVGVDPMVGVRLVNIAAGLGALLLTIRLMRLYGLSRAVRIALLVALVPMCVSYALGLATPDLLITTLLLGYFIIIFDERYPRTVTHGVACGLLGGLSYLSKSYALPFFGAHFALASVLHYIRHRDRRIRRRVIQATVSGLAMFAFIAGMWIVVISAKYGHFTFSTSGTYNLALIGPDSKGHPHDYQGFIPPPNDAAISAWEDPTYTPMSGWRTFASWRNVRHRALSFVRTCARTVSILGLFSPVALVLVVVQLVIVLRRPGDTLLRGTWGWLLWTLLLYCGGYCLVLVEARYLWPCAILLLIIGGSVFERWRSTAVTAGGGRTIGLALLALSFLILPAQHLKANFNRRRAEHDMARAMSEYVPAGSAIASSPGSWASAHILSYHLGARYYGAARADWSAVELAEELQQRGIRYYLVWLGEPDAVKAPAGFARRDVSDVDEVTLYESVSSGP